MRDTAPATDTLRCLKLDQEMSKSEDKRHSSYQKKKKRFSTGKEPAAKFSKTSGRWGGPGRTLGKRANLGVKILCHCTSSGCDTRPAPSKAAVGEFSPCATLFNNFLPIIWNYQVESVSYRIHLLANECA